MSRTGTSVTARFLNLLGVYLGPEEGFLQATDANPKGYWEQLRLMRLNEVILKWMDGVFWDLPKDVILEPPPLPPGWEKARALEPFRQKAQTVINETFADSPLWGWKDPRNCLTLPFWQQLLPDMRYDVRYVICLRNPADVAASLERRDELPLQKGFDHWLEYVTASIVNTVGKPRMFLFFEDYFEDWREQLALLAHFIGRPEGAEEPRIQETVESWVEGGLWHHRSDPMTTIEDPSLPLDLRRLYLALELGVRSSPLGRSARAPATVDDAISAYARQLARRHRRRPELAHITRRAKARIKASTGLRGGISKYLPHDI